MTEQSKTECTGLVDFMNDFVYAANDRKFWYHIPGTNDRWRDMSKQDVVRSLRALYGLRGTKRKGEESTEVERALTQIREVKSIDEIAYLLYRKPGIVHYGGLKVLNLSDVTPVPAINREHPAFKFIESFCLSDRDSDILAKWFFGRYKLACSGKSSPGPVLMVEGPSGSGKSCLAAVMAAALGGRVTYATDPSELDRKSFSLILAAQTPLIYMDLPNQDRASKAELKALQSIATDVDIRAERKYYSRALVLCMHAAVLGGTRLPENLTDWAKTTGLAVLCRLKAAKPSWYEYLQVMEKLGKVETGR